LEYVLKPKYKAIIFDTETHDLENPELIQAALLEVDFIDGKLKKLSEWKGDYKPNHPITYGAMAVHHIIDEDLVNCPPSSEFRLPEVTYLIGHNIPFDYKVVGKPPGIKLIDTLALARSIFRGPLLTSYAQSALTYYLTRSTARNILKNAHDALADVKLCFGILYFICKDLSINSFEDLYLSSEEARKRKVMSYGMHKGTEIKELDLGYILWHLLEADSIEEDYKEAFHEELKRRNPYWSSVVYKIKNQGLSKDRYKEWLKKRYNIYKIENLKDATLRSILLDTYIF
jgi:exodeoxyribonuclease X